MANITKVFTYNLPDDYLSQERTLGKTAEWTFIGPDEICLVINKETNRYHGKFFTGPDTRSIPEALDEYHVHVNCANNPLLCALAHAETEKPDYADLDQQEELLADGLTYKRPLHPPPDHTHDIADIVFDPVTKLPPLRSTFPWKKPHMTWEGIRYWRNGLLASTDDKEGDDLIDMPNSLKTAWAEYRQHLRDIPQTHGAGNIHVFIDLTATAPYNTEGHSLIKVTDATDINVGDDIGVKGWPVVDFFSEHTTVVGVDRVTKVVELSAPLILTPTEANSEIAFSPCPQTAPWKLGALPAPDDQGGPTDYQGNVQTLTAVGNVVKNDW